MATPLLQRDPEGGNYQPGGMFPWDQGIGVTPPKGFTPLQAAPKPPVMMDLPQARSAAPATTLPSTTSIPMPGQDSLPDDFEMLKQQLGVTPPPKKPGILGTIGRGVLDIALQPARAIERIGKFIGSLGLSEEQKKKVDEFYGEGLQESVAGALGANKKDYATQTPRSGKEVVGIALQAGANLSVPFGTSLPAMAAQGAAYAGGKALEENKSLPEAGFDTALGGAGAAILGSLLNVGGAVVGRGFRAAAPEIQKVFKPVADKLGPLLTGTSRQEFDTAFKSAPHILLDYLNVVKDAASPAEAEGILQGRLLENVRTIVNGAKKVEGDAFESAVNTFNKVHPDVTVDIHSVGNRLLDQMPKFGLPRNADEQFALQQVQKIIQEPREYTVNGTRTLLQDLWAFADGLEAGSPAERLAKQAWADVRSELSKATRAVDDGVLDAAMAKYSGFKDNLDQLKPINSKVEDTARSFVRNLAGTNKTAAREALVALQKTAGAEDAAASIQVYNLMKRLVASGKVTGSRVQDVMISGGAVAGLGAIGSLFGPAGAAIGHTLGSLLAIKTMAPSTITNVMLSELKAAGIPITNEIRAALEQAIKNPALRQAIINETTKAANEKTSAE